MHISMNVCFCRIVGKIVFCRVILKNVESEKEMLPSFK